MDLTVQAMTLALIALLTVGCSQDAGTNPACCDEGPVCYDDTFGYVGWGTIDDYAAWSPEGRTIGYCHSGFTELGDTAGIYLVSPQGTDSRLFLPGMHQTPAWSPDSEWLAFSYGAKLYKIRANGEDLTWIPSLPREIRFPDWSPDGKMIVYSCPAGDDMGIWVVPADSENPRMSRRLDPSGQYPDWSHSGRQIVFTGYLEEGWGICVMDSSGADPRLLFGHFDARYPEFSPDDSEITFNCMVPGHVPQVWVMNADGSDPKPLTTCGGCYTAWSPDGKCIVYTDTRRCNGRLWVMNADGSCKRQITLAEWWP